jgi:hypothetical protein
LCCGSFRHYVQVEVGMSSGGRIVLYHWPTTNVLQIASVRCPLSAQPSLIRIRAQSYAYFLSRPMIWSLHSILASRENRLSRFPPEITINARTIHTPRRNMHATAIEATMANGSLQLFPDRDDSGKAAYVWLPPPPRSRSAQAHRRPSGRASAARFQAGAGRRAVI